MLSSNSDNPFCEDLQELPENTTIVWQGKFLDGNLQLGIHPEFSYQILFLIESTDGCLVSGRVRFSEKYTHKDIPEVCDKVIAQLTKEYLEIIVGVKNELIAEGSEHLH